MNGKKDVMKSSMPILCLSLAISACTESAPDQAASPSPEMPMIDACRLITPDELGAVFAGRTFAVDQSGPGLANPPAAQGKNTVTSCTYVSADASPRELVAVTVLLVTAPTDAAHQSIDAMKSGVESLGLNATTTDIPGLGDGAYWVNLGSERRSAVAVNVSQKPRMWLTVSESSSGQPVELTVERLITVAQNVLRRL
jgi:hypothetical protein